jgi:hypothetical protein
LGAFTPDSRTPHLDTRKSNSLGTNKTEVITNPSTQKREDRGRKTA